MKDIGVYIEDKFRNTTIESDNLISSDEIIKILIEFIKLTESEVVIGIELQASSNSLPRYEAKVFDTKDSQIRVISGYLIKKETNER